jgi:putative transposase
LCERSDEKFNKTYRIEVLDCCVFEYLQEVRHHYNRDRPHESMGRIPYV